jgi:hypothetical protein
MAALISDSDLLRVTNADRMPHRSTEKEIDWPSDYYSRHAARTFMSSETFHRAGGDASRRQRFLLNVQAARSGANGHTFVNPIRSKVFTL